MTGVLRTRINYLYRDGGNFKAHGHVVVAGRVTFSDVEPFLDERRYFIPELVGFPVLCIEGFPRDPDLDHDWCELEERDFRGTEEAATQKEDSAMLMELFRAAAFNGWLR